MIELDIQLPRSEFDVLLKREFCSKSIGIFGPSGAGKTSIFEAISGLAKETRGIIKVGNETFLDSENNIDLTVQERRVGYVFQESRLFSHLSVRKNLEFGYKAEQTVIAFEEAIRILQLNNVLDKMPKRLSGGQARRVAIGRALLSNPRILLLDEPFSGLDDERKLDLREVILSLKSNHNLPMFIISHNKLDLESLVDEIVIIDQGKQRLED